MKKRTWKRGNGGSYYCSNYVMVYDGLKMSEYMIARNIRNLNTWIICYFNKDLLQYTPLIGIKPFSTLVEAQNYISSLDIYK